MSTQSRPPRPAGRWGRHLSCFVAGLALLGALVTAPSGARAAPAAPAGLDRYTQQAVDWGPCAWFTAGTPGPVPQCATVTVPRDWARPGAGVDLSVAISRTTATDPGRRLGVLATNPGGPGGSGITLPLLVAGERPAVAARYDVIGMDPRGVGFSTQLNCEVPLAPFEALQTVDSRDLSARSVRIQQAAAKALADGCAANPLSPFINTWQTAHDLDLVRALLGERRLNYLGYSYGTWLGAKYAALFPRNTGKVVLDANTEWTGDIADAWELQPKSFQRRFERQALPWVARNPVLSPYVGRTAAQAERTYEAARAAYIELKDNPFYGTVLDATFLQALYSDGGMLTIGLNLAVLKACLVDRPGSTQEQYEACRDPLVTELLTALNASTVAATRSVAPRTDRRTGLLTDGLPPLPGDLAPLALKAAAVEEPTASTPGVYYAVRCGDGGDWHSVRWWTERAARLGPRYPLAGYTTYNREVCPYWRLPVRELPQPDARRLDPLVTVQSEFDPATGYESTVDNVSRFRDARLVAIDDAGAHGQYVVAGNGCVNALVDGYLVYDALPARRTVCTATPLPYEDRVHPVRGPVDRDPNARRGWRDPAAPAAAAQLRRLVR